MSKPLTYLVPTLAWLVRSWNEIDRQAIRDGKQEMMDRQGETQRVRPEPFIGGFTGLEAKP